MKNLIFFLAVSLLFSGCANESAKTIISVSNPGDTPRYEVVEVSLSELETDLFENGLYPYVYKVSDERPVMFQLVDRDMDDVEDILLIWAEVGSGEEVNYAIAYQETEPEFESRVFSRFVPERTDDYAWENDKVAFRTYGPEAQRMVEEGIAGGTLSSGIDCWLKKVDYLIIDKWYGKTLRGEGSYHEDTGEGLDNFHVGSSRGCGGIGVYENEELYISKNFTDWNVVSNGPLRTSFELDYEDWQAGEVSVQEKKYISLDYMSNLMKVEAEIEGPEIISVGLTLHENDGEVSADTSAGWFSYYQPHGDSFLGMGIVCDKKYFAGYSHVVSEEADKSHLLVHLKVMDGKIEYYTGFGWQESGEFGTQAEWEEYLSEFAAGVEKALRINIKTAK